MAPNNTEQTFNDSSLSNDNSDNNINIATIPQSQLDDQYQAPNKKKTSISFHSSANGSGGLDVSDTSRRSSSSTRAKSKRRSSLFTRRPSFLDAFVQISNPEDRHAALDDEEGRFSFICYCVCRWEKRDIRGETWRLGLVAILCTSYALFYNTHYLTYII